MPTLTRKAPKRRTPASKPSAKMNGKAAASKAKPSKNVKRVYFFGNGKAEGNAGMKDLLGGKGANLAEMSSL
ncbi:MAG TPA: hypothetical protein VLJ39_01515, partial [Tepidisphaeraceae bacterium]|nr:hypothetical protein [Tepidisphaeraceae bacterium]